MKKLLVITQKVDKNEQLLGFFVEWLREFSKRFDKVTVLCLEKGEFDLPDNVKIISLGKDRGLPKISWLMNFYKYILGHRKEYDSVFVHMNPRYVVYGGIPWRLMGKKISLWYAHGYVGPMLRLADKLTNISFTSTPEGYRIDSTKKVVVGQGIDTERFRPNPENENRKFRIVSIGRIASVKNYETLIKAVSSLDSSKIEVKIVGGIGKKEDQKYLNNLKELAREKDLSDIIDFVGPVSNYEIINTLQSSDLFVNMSHTGSLDKAILEAMSTGVIVLTCNEALENVLGRYNKKLMYPKKDHQVLREKIVWVMDLDSKERKEISEDLRKVVIEEHNLSGLIDKISTKLINS